MTCRAMRIQYSESGDEEIRRQAESYGCPWTETYPVCPRGVFGDLGRRGIFEAGTGTVAGIHWSAWLGLPVAAAAGGAIAGSQGRRGISALGSAGGTLIALGIFAFLEMRD